MSEIDTKFRGIDLRKWAPAHIYEFVSAPENQTFKLYIIENMETFGGSFVKSLAECMRRADRHNLYKLVEAFMEYVIDYQPLDFQYKK